jgi:hypothetical protein
MDNGGKMSKNWPHGSAARKRARRELLVEANERRNPDRKNPDETDEEDGGLIDLVDQLGYNPKRKKEE